MLRPTTGRVWGCVWRGVSAVCVCVAAVGCTGQGGARSGEGAPVVVKGEWEEIGWSVEGRPLRAITIGEGDARVLVVGGIHGDEREAQPSISRLVELLGAPEASGAATWRVIRDLNPDGSALTRRANARQVDLNRNFPARNFARRDRHGAAPLSEPESAALARLIATQRPTLIVVFHSSSYGPFVNYDGPASGAAIAFAEGASRVDDRWRLVPEMSYATPGSLGSAYGVDEGIPVLTVEFERGQPASEVWLAIEGGFGSLATYLGRTTAARAESGLGE